MAGLTRKEIKEDRIRHLLTDIVEWTVEHQSLLVAAIVAAIVVAMAGWGWSAYRNSQDREAQAAFSEALRIYQAAIKSPDQENAEGGAVDPLQDELTYESEEARNTEAAQAFQEVASNYPSTGVGPWARYYIGLLKLRQDEDAKAEGREILLELSQRADSPLIRNLASDRLGADAAQSDRWEDAVGHYKAILDNPAPSYPIQSLLLRLAQGQEDRGNIEGALENYRRLQAEFPTSDEARTAARRIEVLAPDEEPSEPSEGQETSE